MLLGINGWNFWQMSKSRWNWERANTLSQHCIHTVVVTQYHTLSANYLRRWRSWHISQFVISYISVSPRSSAIDWEHWVWVSAHTPPSACPRWSDQKAPGHNKAAGNLPEVLGKWPSQRCCFSPLILGQRVISCFICLQQVLQYHFIGVRLIQFYSAYEYLFVRQWQYP